MFEGTLIIVVALLLIPLLWIAVVKSQKPDGEVNPLPNQCVEHIVWEGSYTAAFQFALDVFGAMNAEVIEADPNTGMMTAKINRQFIFTVIQLEMRTTEGVTIIVVRAFAELPVDFGVSRKSAQKFLSVWETITSASDAETLEE